MLCAENWFWDESIELTQHLWLKLLYQCTAKNGEPFLSQGNTLTFYYFGDYL
jgi:hypothetical protein